VTTTIEGVTDGAGLHIGLAVASWNQTITDRLLGGATARCEELGVSEVTILRVPGALELPLAAKALAESGCDAVVAIGTVVKGDTDHYEIVVRESTSGITRATLDTGVPVTNAILAVHDYGQAVERSDQGDSNKGVEAVDAAVLMATALARLEIR
jgi:6,7-dimethyl-8-ribityllumazine synthase